MKKHLLIPITILLTFASLMSAAAAAEDEPDHGPWSITLYEDVVFCMEPSPVLVSEEDRLQLALELTEILNESWGAVSSLSFTGGFLCRASESGIRVRIADETPGVAALGNWMNGIPNGVVLNSTFENWQGPFPDAGLDCRGDDRSLCFQYQAVSIFGYALGLAPRDTPTGSTNCDLRRQAPAHGGDLYFANITTESVMDMCRGGLGTFGLTAGDVRAVRAVYGPWNTDFPMFVDLHATVDILDDEFGTNEFGSFTTSAQLAVGQGVTNSSFSDEWCVGKEVRVTGSWTIIAPEPYRRPLVPSLVYRHEMFEGKSCGTTASVATSRGAPAVNGWRTITSGMTNRGTFGGDQATIVTNVFVDYRKMLANNCDQCAVDAEKTAFDWEFPDFKSGEEQLSPKPSLPGVGIEPVTIPKGSTFPL